MALAAIIPARHLLINPRIVCSRRQSIYVYKSQPSFTLRATSYKMWGQKQKLAGLVGVWSLLGGRRVRGRGVDATRTVLQGLPHFCRPRHHFFAELRNRPALKPYRNHQATNATMMIGPRRAIMPMAIHRAGSDQASGQRSSSIAAHATAAATRRYRTPSPIASGIGIATPLLSGADHLAVGDPLVSVQVSGVHTQRTKRLFYYQTAKAAIAGLPVFRDLNRL